MDLSLAVLVGLIAVYAGAVAALVLARPNGAARALATGAGTAAGVIASFALMLLLARVWLPGTVVVAALFTGAVAYLTLLRDLGAARARLVAVAAGLVVAGSFAFVSYLAVLALIAAAGLYLVLRRWLRVRPALLVMGGAFGCLLVASAAVFLLALSTM